MAEADKTGQLSVKQENAIDLLLQGQSDREVAEAVGVTRQTVTGWRNDNASFAAELNRRRQEVWGGQVERLRLLVKQAVDVLEENLNQTGNLQLKQAAAVHVLRAVGLYNGSLEPRGETTAEGVEAERRNEEFSKTMARLG
ncbi:MAG: helix-turn-helix domain-containing protein, partial [Bacilli bacterium]